MTQSSTAWQAGYAAGAAGLPVTRCPALAGSIAAWSWCAGHVEGAAETRKRKESNMEHNTRYATENDFWGRLYYRLPDTKLQESGIGPIPDLWDLDAIMHSISTLRETFERLERAGVYVPSAFGLTDDCEPGPKESWQDLLKQIDHSVYYLHSIVMVLLNEELRPTMDSVCCG
jgi:hypothetical protein